MHKDADVARAYAVCHEYALSRTHGYGIGAQWLPPDKRPYCEALLAFAMHTDTLADDTNTPPEMREIRFRSWRDDFQAVQDGRGGRADHIARSLCVAFVDTMTTWGFTEQSAETYLNAQAEEVTFRHFTTYAELKLHADELIGTTCAWANVIYGGTTPESERRSRKLAMASQLSDYLVDLRADLARGRLYLPLEDLDRFGVDRSMLEEAASSGQTPDKVRHLVKFEAARARAFCDSGSGWELLVEPSARDAAWLPGVVYRHQVEQIEMSGGDIFGSPPVRVEELAERIRADLTSHTAATEDGTQFLGSVQARRDAGTPTAILPEHLGIILDGNRRWARSHGVPIEVGHRRGGAVLRDLIVQLFARGIEYVTVYLFSTENWARDPQEVSDLMTLLADLAGDTTDILCSENVRMRFVGRPDELPRRLRTAISRAEQRTAKNDGGTLAICVNYGGFMEISDAFRSMYAAGVSVPEISPETVANYLYAPDIPAMDLVLRTGGEQRLSNFMLWRAAYAELAFVSKMWPDITIGDVEDVLDNYAASARRFGA